MISRDTPIFLYFADFRKLNGYILTLDQEKAFDYMHRDFLFKVLRKMQFGEKILEWLSVLYTDTQAHVLVNGFVSIMFPVERGVRQGCPLSAPLYSIYVETLIAAIEADPLILPFNIPGRRVPKTIQYADDFTLLLSNRTSLTQLFKICQDFERATGSTINVAKTQGLTLGRPSSRDPFFDTIHWRNDSGLEILGMTYFPDYLRTQNANWLKLLSAIRTDFTHLKARSLSLTGKVLILNAVILAKVWYKASVLPLLPPDQRTLEKLIFDFLWDGKPDPIQRRTVYLPTAQGGLGLTHPLYQQQSLHLKILYYVTSTLHDQPWLQLPRYWLGRTLAPLRRGWAFLGDNHLPHFIGADIPPYYRQLLDNFSVMDLSQLPPPDGVLLWKTHHFYPQFMKAHYHQPKVYTDFWSYHHVDPNTMWKHVYTSYAFGSHKDVHFKILHRVLPTLAFMRCRFRGRGYNRLNTGCRSCPNHNVETIPHIFFRCIHAEPLLTYIYPSIDVLLQHKPFKLFHLTLNVFPPNISPPVQRMIVTLLQITFYVLWTHRNVRQFDGRNPSVLEGRHRIRQLF